MNGGARRSRRRRRRERKREAASRALVLSVICKRGVRRYMTAYIQDDSSTPLGIDVGN